MQVSSSSIASQQSSVRVCRQRPSLNNGKYLFNIDLYHNGNSGREEAEQFIKNGYLKTYNAQIEVSTPWLLAINKGEFKAALGIRPANEALFLEQYLNETIEQTLAHCCDWESSERVSRNEIAEIGSLYSNANKFTIPLFLTTAVSLFCNQYKYMVFSATEHLLSLIRKAGLRYTHLAQANPSMLKATNENWGSYYQTHPEVVSLSLQEVIAVISANKGLAGMLSSLEPRIAVAASKMAVKV